MSTEISLAPNFTQDEITSPLLPRLPLLSSHQSGWNGIRAYYHRQPAWETPDSCGPYHTIVINQSKKAARIKYMLGGQRQSRQALTGDIAIIPANVQHRMSWDQEADFLLILLDHTFISQVAHESFNPDIVEITSHSATSDPLIDQIGSLLKSELEFNEPCSRLYVDSLATMLSIRLLRKYSIQKPAVQYYSGGMSKSDLQRVIEYIHENLSRELSLKELANVLPLSPNYFTTLFKQSTGLSAYQYVVRCRIEKSKQLMTMPDLALTEVSQQVGFQSQSCFINAFRKQIGVTPKTYRDAQKQNWLG